MGSTADAGQRGDDAARGAAMEAGTTPDGGGAAFDATTDAGGGGTQDATTDVGGEGMQDATTDGGGTQDASDDSPGEAGADVVVSNQCTNGIISIASDVLNPGDVYLNGTLKDGVCYLDALTHWSDPNSACTGFDCYFDPLTAVIRPTDGRMLYMNTFEYSIREFHADSCPMPPMSAYPATPLANDTIIPTPMCPTAPAGTTAGIAGPDGAVTGVAGFLVSPEGDVYYSCFAVADAGAVYDLAGNVVYNNSNGYPLYKLARGHMALVGSYDYQNFKLANLTTGVLTDLGTPPPWMHDAGALSPPNGSIMVVRALDPAGFWVAVAYASSDPELWEIHPDGTSTKIGAYPPTPNGQILNPPPGQSALDGCGALLQISSYYTSNLIHEYTIVRRELQGSSVVVYDEARMPLVRVFDQYLVTGP